MAEGLVNQVGYDQLRRGQVDGAVQTFKNNTEAFPGSPNTYDSLGDAYCRAGDVASARQSYERAARVAQSQSPPHPRAWRVRGESEQGVRAGTLRVWCERIISREDAKPRRETILRGSFCVFA